MQSTQTAARGIKLIPSVLIFYRLEQLIRDMRDQHNVNSIHSTEFGEPYRKKRVVSGYGDTYGQITAVTNSYDLETGFFSSLFRKAWKQVFTAKNL